MSAGAIPPFKIKVLFNKDLGSLKEGKGEATDRKPHLEENK